MLLDVARSRPWKLAILLGGAIIVATFLTAALLWPSARPASAAGVEAIAAGYFHTCALTTAGGVQCWGTNSSGQLGDGRTCGIMCTTPVDVVGLTSGVAAVAAGASHTCALTITGGVQCWGVNFAGHMGDGTNISRPTPVDVCVTGAIPPCNPANNNILSGVAAIAVGGSHTCALTTAGGVKCWGQNDNGQLGDLTTTLRNTPVDVCPDAACTTNLSGVDAVSAGTSHTCARTIAFVAMCWGRNEEGQVGDGTTTQRNTPVDVVGLSSGVAAVAAGGSHTCALTTAGGVQCWGANFHGQLGDGVTCGNPCTTPVDVTGLSSGVAAVAAGSSHTCALTTAGGVQCWGSNADGQLGDGGTCGINCTTPVDVAGLGPKPTPTATSTPTATPTDTSTPTATPTATNTPTTTATGTPPTLTATATGTPPTPTATATPTAATATATPVPTLTPTPMATAIPTLTPTPTATPPKALGDVNDDGTVNAIDAALILQLDAGLITALPNSASADVNEDGTINSIDAALILQFTAGLLGGLPPP